MKKQKAIILGTNKEGMKQGGKTILKLFAFIGGLFGALLTIFSVWIGLLIIAGAITFWVCINKSKSN